MPIGTNSRQTRDTAGELPNMYGFGENPVPARVLSKPLQRSRRQMIEIHIRLSDAGRFCSRSIHHWSCAKRARHSGRCSLISTARFPVLGYVLGHRIRGSLILEVDRLGPHGRIKMQIDDMQCLALVSLSYVIKCVWRKSTNE